MHLGRTCQGRELLPPSSLLGRDFGTLQPSSSSDVDRSGQRHETGDNLQLMLVMASPFI